MGDPELLEAAAAALRDHLAEYPHVQLVQTEDEISVEGSPNGFDVSLTADDGELTLAAGGWHDHYEVPSEAADMFMWLLSPRARIVATAYGETEYSWTFEIEDEGAWTTVTTMAIALPRPFWRRRRRIVRQNSHLD